MIRTPATCHDCDAKEGQIHELGCDMERCPFCGGQLITCDCCYEKPQHIDCAPGTDVYENGLDEKQQERWLQTLNAEGRIPYIRWPNLCAYCGELWPKMFNVSEEEWKRWIQPDTRGRMVCRGCYDWITSLGEGQVPRQNPQEQNP